MFNSYHSDYIHGMHLLMDAIEKHFKPDISYKDIYSSNKYKGD